MKDLNAVHVQTKEKHENRVMLLYKYVALLNANYGILLRSSVFSKEKYRATDFCLEENTVRKDKADAHEHVHRNYASGFPRCEVLLYTAIPTYVLLAIIYKIN